MAKIVKGEKRGRPGKWLVDWTDATSRRRVLTFNTREEATEALAAAIRDSRQKSIPTVDVNITMGEYAERWLKRVAVNIKPSSWDAYETTWRVHLAPTLRDIKFRTVTRAVVRDHLVGKLQAGRARATVASMLSLLRQLCHAAMDDGLLTTNPCARVGRELKLGRKGENDDIKAMTSEQLAAFLDACATATRETDRRLYPFFMLLARTGMRLGEALELRVNDLDFGSRSIRVARTVLRRQVGSPKGGKARDVDMSTTLAAVLRQHLAARTPVEGQALVFASAAGDHQDEGLVRDAMRRACQAAGIPATFSPHSLRHTFASLLLQRGESPAYVQEQLGHASISMTVDTYGKWLRKRPTQGGVDALDTAFVANRSSDTPLATPAANDINGLHAAAG